MADLRAVKPGETRPAPKTVVEAAEQGTHRELLVAMRGRIARAVQNPDCPPRDLAALTRRLQDIARDIATIDARAGEDGISEAGHVEDDAWDAEAL